MQERLSKGSRHLPPLQVGDHVLVQDQHGNNPRQWNKSGVVVEVGTHDSYFVSVGGSRQVTKRNRQFLRKIQPQQQSFEDSEAAQTPPRTRPVTRASSSLSTTPPPTCPPAPPPSVRASPPPPPTVPAQPPAPAPAPQFAQPPVFQPPPPPIRDEFYPYGEGRIVAQQPGYPVVSYQPPYWPSPSLYHSYPGPGLPPHTLHSVTPAFAWPSHLPSSGQQLRGGGRQDDQRFRIGPQQSSQAYYAPLHLSQ